MTFTLDTSEFSRAASSLRAATRKDARMILKQQGRLAVRDAVKMTPPFRTGGQNEPFNVQRKMGEAAIRMELIGGRGDSTGSARYAGIFTLIEPWMNKFKVKRRRGKKSKATVTKTVRLFITKKGRVYGVDRELYRPNASISEMDAHHQKYRSTRTGKVTQAGARTRDVGRWRFIEKMAVNGSRFRAYLRHVFAKVGKAKAGWPITQSGNKVPRWIMRHATGGIWIDATNHPTQPSITFGNNVQYIQGSGAELRIMQRVFANRIYNMKAVTEKALQHRAKQHSAR